MDTSEISSIIAQWKESQKYEWNILESIRINENAHTNILSDILKIEVNGKRVFLETFITNVLKIKGFANSQRISKNKNSYEELDVKTQVQAISKKKCGYIDLLIEDVKNEKVIIIENKMCGAGDCKNQLQRYWCTYAKHNPVLHKDFKEAYENFKEKKKYSPKNVFIVYLTADEDQKPEVDEKWMKIWNKTFRQISSTEIIEWLQQTVLTNMPYFQNGYASQSVKLYLEILSQSFCPENRWSKEQVETINKIIFGKQSTPNKKTQFKTAEFKL